MTESLFIFGNGLGRSINNEAYQLKPAMQAVWGNKENGLSDDHKTTIQKSLALQDNNTQDGPQEEGQLKTIQEVIFACELLQKIEDIRLPFESDETQKILADITQEASELPDALRTYVRQVAIQFLGTDKGKLDAEFSKGLIYFINKRTKPVHIATTNYDDLLYEAFFADTRTVNYGLLDGCPRNDSGQFEFNRLETEISYKMSKKHRGWYLHLHGSPLYVDMDENVRKLTRGDFMDPANHKLPGHIVLTHHAFKRRIIEESPVLNAYWNIFCEKLSKSTNIILFGMSGEDDHINEAIRAYARKGATIRIVDWEGENPTVQTRAEEEECWEKRLRKEKFNKANLILLRNVQDFKDWALPQSLIPIKNTKLDHCLPS